MEEKDFLNKINILINAAKAYYNSTSLLLDDTTYDKLLLEVRNALASKPNLASYIPDGVDLYGVSLGIGLTGDIKHETRMLSLSNVFTQEELLDFVNKSIKNGGNIPEWVVEPKLDGLSLSIVYTKGSLSHIATRGDSSSGDRVTKILPILANVPAKLNSPISVDIRGECFLTQEDFEQVNRKRLSTGKAVFANPRNGIAGIVRLKQVPTDISVSFLAYDAIFSSEDKIGISTHQEVLEKVLGLGVPVVPFEIYQSPESMLLGINNFSKLRNSLGYPTDGAVVKVNNLSIWEELGYSSGSPKYAVAYKYSPESVMTRLVSIEWQLGRSGSITPVANLEPVFVGGVVVSSASLHNYSELKNKDLRVGDMVWVHRAGEVVPEVIGPNKDLRTGAESEVDSLTVCPRCLGGIDKSSKIWRCSNKEDCVIVERITWACSRDILDIESIGPRTAGALVAAGLVNDVPDLFCLKYSDIVKLPGFAGVSSEKIINEVEKASTKNWSWFVLSYGIPYLGRRVRKTLEGSFPTFESFYNASKKDLSELNMIGPIKASAIFDRVHELDSVWARFNELNLLKDCGSESIKSGSDNLKDSVVVITGTFPGYTRSAIESIIIDAGGSVVSSVTKKTTLVLVGDSPGSKADRAATLGVKMIYAYDFPAWLVTIRSSKD